MSSSQQLKQQSQKAMHQNKQAIGSMFSKDLLASAPAQQSTLKAEQSIMDTLKNDKRFSKLVSLLNDNKGSPSYYYFHPSSYTITNLILTINCHQSHNSPYSHCISNMHLHSYYSFRSY